MHEELLAYAPFRLRMRKMSSIRRAHANIWDRSYDAFYTCWKSLCALLHGWTI